MRTSGLRCRDCVFVNRCVFMYTMTQTQSVPAKSLVYETPTSPLTSPPHTQWSHSARGAAGASARHQRDPLPVLSPFNDWISSRLPSSRVIAWWSARCGAKAGGGDAWQSLWCWLGQGRAEIAAAEAFGVADRTVTARGFHTERDQNEKEPCCQRKDSIMDRLFLFAEPAKDCVTPKASLHAHTHPNLSLCSSWFLSVLFAITYLLFFSPQNH